MAGEAYLTQRTLVVIGPIGVGATSREIPLGGGSEPIKICLRGQSPPQTRHWGLKRPTEILAHWSKK